MSAEFLAVLAGAVLSLLFSYIPGLNVWFGGLESTYKRLIMLGLLAAVAGVVYGMACAGWGESFGIALTCDQAGLVELLKAFGLAAIANQTAYGLSPEPAAVQVAKATR